MWIIHYRIIAFALTDADQLADRLLGHIDSRPDMLGRFSLRDRDSPQRGQYHNFLSRPSEKAEEVLYASLT